MPCMTEQTLIANKSQTERAKMDFVVPLSFFFNRSRQVSCVLCWNRLIYESVLVPVSSPQEGLVSYSAHQTPGGIGESQRSPDPRGYWSVTALTRPQGGLVSHSAHQTPGGIGELQRTPDGFAKKIKSQCHRMVY